MTAQLKKLAALFDQRDKLYFAGLLGLMVIGSLLEAIGVGAIPAFVAALAIPERVMAYPVLASLLESLGITTGRQLVIWGVVGLSVVYLLKNIFQGIVLYVQVRTIEHYEVRLAQHLFRTYMLAPYEFHLGRNSAELLRNVKMESKEIVRGVISSLLNTAKALLMTTFILILLIAVTPWIALLAISVVGAGSFLFTRMFKNKLLRYGQEGRRQRKLSVQAIQQGLGSLQEARILGTEAFFIKAFHRSVRRFALAQRLVRFVNGISKPTLEYVAVTGVLLAVLAMVFTGADMEALMPMLALFGAAIVRLRGTLSSIVSSISQMRYSAAAIDPVFDDLHRLQGIGPQMALLQAEARGRQISERLLLERAIVIDRVAYTYPDADVPTLRNITLTIERGCSVAFVGETGSGKTTIINVLLGLLKPQQGRISVDDVDIYDNLEGWRANVGYIPQTIYLLDDTIRRNIAFGLPDQDIEEEKLWNAIRAAQLEDFIWSLDRNIDTVVGEQGVRLSGGQRQRIGLARALYHNPEVLIMDEATSSLDNQTEGLVMQALEELKEGRTTIMIAHRLSTVRNCDRLYFMKDGRIDAMGTYEDLQELHGDFRRMAGTA